jgi:very-short-patch-repair endonuclease
MKTGVVIEAKTRKNHLRYRDSLIWAARVNRRKETMNEDVLWNKLLRRKQLGYKFSRQKPIDRFIVDFYCSELRLVIEVDGGSHMQKLGRDGLRDKFLDSCGIRTLRVSDKDVLGNLDKVRKLIFEFIKPLPCQGKGVGGRV